MNTSLQLIRASRPQRSRGEETNAELAQYANQAILGVDVISIKKHCSRRNLVSSANTRRRAPRQRRRAPIAGRPFYYRPMIGRFEEGQGRRAGGEAAKIRALADILRISGRDIL